MDRFLQYTLGEAGAKVIAQLIKAEPSLQKYIIPRIVVSFLQGDDVVCGRVVSGASLAKSDGRWDGVVDVGGFSCGLTKADLCQTAAVLSVALGIIPSSGDLTPGNIVRIGQTIDALVKSYRDKGRAGDNAGVGKPAAHLAPIPKDEPGSTDLDRNVASRASSAAPTTKLEPPKMSVGAIKTKSSIPKLTKPKKSPADVVRDRQKKDILLQRAEIRVSKSQTNVVCELCRRPMFVGESFAGCLCLSELAKSIQTIDDGDTVTLIFDKDIEDLNDAVATVSGALNGR